jgi:hypothetical protein
VNIHHIKGSVPDARPIAVSGLTESEYRDLPGLTQSEINLFLRSPRLLKLNVREESDAMRMGTLLHSAVLLRRVDCYVRPEVYGPESKPWNNNAKECKEWNAARADKPILSSREKNEILDAAGDVACTDGVGFLLRHGEAEVALLCATGKGRIDYIIDRGDYLDVVDLKTTRDGRFRSMQRTIHERGYHIQAAWYRRLLREIDPRPIRYRIIAVELEPITRAQAWTLLDRAIDLGDERIDWALERMEECQASDNWPAYHRHDMGPDGMIDVPEYAYPEPELTGLTEITT